MIRRRFSRTWIALEIERAGLINYVAPKIIGFTPEVNDWSAKYCSAAPDRLIAFGGVLPGTVPDAGAEVDRMAKIGIRAIKLHPSHQVMYAEFVHERKRRFGGDLRASAGKRNAGDDSYGDLDFSGREKSYMRSRCCATT